MAKLQICFIFALMIRREEIFPVGQLLKPHGLKGEMTFRFDTDVFDTKDAEYFVLDTDGIFVPFFIEEYRFKSNETAFVKLESIDSVEQAKELSNTPVYLPNSFVDAENEIDTIHYFVAFDIEDKHLGRIGKITSVDDSTENVLFVVNRNDDEILIPATNAFIQNIDEEKRIIYTDLPEGLID